jgi:hypothetical protein
VGEIACKNAKEYEGKKMKHRLKVILLGIVVVIVAVCYAYIQKNTYLYPREVATDAYIATGVLLEGESITQSFVCEEDSMQGLNVKMTHIGEVSEVVVVYTITEVDTGKSVSAKMLGSEISNNKFNKLPFEILENTKGKQYEITLQEENGQVNQGIGFYLSLEGKSGELVVRGEQTEGSLIVRTLTQRFDFETFLVFLGLIAYIWIFIQILYKLFQ